MRLNTDHLVVVVMYGGDGDGDGDGGGGGGDRCIPSTLGHAMVAS